MSKKVSDMTLDELWHLFPIRLTAPNPRWETDYQEMAAQLRCLFSDRASMVIHHIGSTAIRGIWAKPIVDVLVEMDGSEDMEAIAMNCISETI